ncbi:hypothetical protein BKA93DRAFT_829638 [Sparassis latifolia]
MQLPRHLGRSIRDLPYSWPIVGPGSQRRSALADIPTLRWHCLSIDHKSSWRLADSLARIYVSTLARELYSCSWTNYRVQKHRRSRIVSVVDAWGDEPDPASSSGFSSLTSGIKVRRASDSVSGFAMRISRRSQIDAHLLEVLHLHLAITAQTRADPTRRRLSVHAHDASCDDGDRL